MRKTSLTSHVIYSLHSTKGEDKVYRMCSSSLAISLNLCHEVLDQK